MAMTAGTIGKELSVFAKFERRRNVKKKKPKKF